MAGAAAGGGGAQIAGWKEGLHSDIRGGCVTYEFRFAPGASPVLAGTAGSAVDFVPRSRLVGYVRQTEGLALCGRGAACPG